jgi:uridine phosphorylase
MCHSAGVSAAIICVTLLNRLVGDQIQIPENEYEELTGRSLKVAGKFIKRRLAGHKFNPHEDHCSRSGAPKSPN